MNVLTLGLAGLGLYWVMQPKKTTQTTVPSSGIIYKCDHIEVVDKDKFHQFLDEHAQSYISKIKGSLNLINYRIYLMELIEKLNKKCYTLFIDKTFSKDNLIALLLISHEAYGSLARAFFKKDIFTQEELESQEHKQFTITVDSTRTPFLTSLNTFGITDSDIDPYEHLFDLNGNKFPKK